MKRSQIIPVLLMLLVAFSLRWWLSEFHEVTVGNRGPEQPEDGSGMRDRSAILALSAAPASRIAPVLFPPDSPVSSHPVERAAASGVVLETRVEATERVGRWLRSRLLQTEIQPRPVRVVEHWEVDASGHSWVCVGRNMYLADQLIVKVRPGLSEVALRERLATLGMQIESRLAREVFSVRLPEAKLDTVPEAIRLLSAHPELAESAEPDGVGFGAGLPNDSRFGEQWGLHNTGQSGGIADADVDAPEFWDILESAPGIMVAVLDSGLNFTHPDLQGVAWVNPGEIPGDGLDNDGSGKVDDINGWDFVNNDNNPTDDHGHGSNVTGITAANRNNATGIAGLVSGVRIVVCKILNSSNSGTTSNLIAATTYARLRGVPVMNLSLQNYPFSTTLNTEFTACQTAGILLAICAGNQGVNNDTTPNYPSSYPHPNIIAVGNHDRTDVRWAGSFNPSNFGLTSVDLFAPGREILSPVLGTSYSSYTGTSQAAPFVTALAAAIKFVHPSWQAAEIKGSILAAGVPVSSYSGLCVTGARLNAVSALAQAFRQSPFRDSDGDGFSDLFEYLAGSRVDQVASQPVVFTSSVGGFFRVGVSRVARSDAHLAVETSPDLLSWTTTGITDFSSIDTLLGGISLSGAPRGFVRIQAFPTP